MFSPSVTNQKPSDGLRAKFPAYNYDDMVQAQYRVWSCVSNATRRV